MPRLLFICSGNTCRSPLAAAHARALAAGISAVDGATASGHAQTVAARAGTSLAEHRSVRVDAGILDAADLVLTMTAVHRDRIHAAWPQHRERVLTLGEAAGVDLNVHDPFGGEEEAYEQTSREIRQLIRAAWPEIERRLQI
jgi:protein-tyrosine phosphatase